MKHSQQIKTTPVSSNETVKYADLYCKAKTVSKVNCVSARQPELF
jgi:hypothetical protein